MKDEIFGYAKDVLFIIGFIAFEAGLWLLSREFALIVGGMLLMFLGFPVDKDASDNGSGAVAFISSVPPNSVKPPPRKA